MDTKQIKTNQTLSSDFKPSLEKHVSALLSLLAEVHGHDQLVLKAGKLDSLELMQSDKIEDRYWPWSGWSMRSHNRGAQAAGRSE